MEVLLDKLSGLILTLVGALASVVIWLYKRSDKKHEVSEQKIEQLSKELTIYKEQQYKDSEMHRIRYDAEMSRLEARLEGVTVALEYMNKNINSIDSNVSTLQKTVNEIFKEIRK